MTEDITDAALAYYPHCQRCGEIMLNGGCVLCGDPSAPRPLGILNVGPRPKPTLGAMRRWMR